MKNLNKTIIIKFLSVYFIISCLSYIVFLYYTESNKKIDITLNMPSVIPNTSAADFLENTFKDNVTEIKNTFQDCYNMTLLSSPQNNIVDYTSSKNTEFNILSKIKENLNQYNLPNTDVDLIVFGTQKCRLLVNNPIEYRNRSLIFILLFNLIHAALILTLFDLLRSKNKSD